MAKTVDQFSTLEDFRQKYNELAVDVGDKSGLRTTATGTIVDSLNSLEDYHKVKYCNINGIKCFRGSEDNVYDRFNKCCKKF